MFFEAQGSAFLSREYRLSAILHTVYGCGGAATIRAINAVYCPKAYFMGNLL